MYENIKYFWYFCSDKVSEALAHVGAEKRTATAMSCVYIKINN